MSHSDRFPHDVKSINGQRETFNTVVLTIDKVFTNFGTGYSFVEDTTVDDQGRKPIWNMQGNYTNGKREDYSGVVYEAGDRIEADLSLNPGRGSKIFYDIKRAAKVNEGTPVTKYDAPPPPVKTAPIDVRISKGMAFNNLTTMLASPESAQAFSGKALAEAWNMWHMALEDTMAGKSPFSREADIIADAVTDDGVVDLADVEPIVDKSVMPDEDPLDELVESLPWDSSAPSVDDLKQKGVALMQSKWDTPIDAADELRSALGLPQDWSQMTAEQWQSVIDFAEAKASE